MNVDQSAVRKLHIAASRGNIKCVNDYLQKVPVDSVDEQSQTALHYACAEGEVEIVRQLIKKGASLDCRNWCGWVPMMLAACYGHVEIVKLLIRNNANVNVENDGGVSPLACAATFGRLQVVEVLLEHKVEINPTVKTDREVVYVTPLMFAAQHGYVEIVAKLLQYDGGATDYVNPDTGYSALMIAALNGHLKIVQTLIEKGSADVNLRNIAGKNAYELSILKKRKDVRGYLEKRTTNLTPKSPLYETTLIEATRRKNIELVKRYVENKTYDVNMTDENGVTPLYWACVLGNPYLVELLLENGANPDVQDNTYGWTPLMQSIVKRHVDIIMLLLKYRADINVRNNSNLSVFDIATRVGMPEITRLVAPKASGTYDPEDFEKKPKQTWIEKVGGKMGIKPLKPRTFSRVSVHYDKIGDMEEEEGTEELNKTSSVLSVFDANKALSGSAKVKLSLLSPQVILPDDVVAPTLPPFSKLVSFDYPKMPIVSTRLSSSNGSNTEWSPKNSSNDSSSFQAHLQNMGKKKCRSLKRPQEEGNNIPLPCTSKQPDSPQSSITSSGFTSISQIQQGPFAMPKQSKKDSPPMFTRPVEFQKAFSPAWSPPSIYPITQPDMYSRHKKKSISTLPDINDLSIKSVSSISSNQNDDIKSLLHHLNLEDYHSKFEEEEVDIETLREMDENDLKLMGIDKTVYRHRILDAAGKQKKKRKSKSRSVHDMPVNNVRNQSLVVTNRPGSSSSAALRHERPPLLDISRGLP